MATSITLRSVKGSALTHAEVDDNFSNLKATADAALPSATAATTYQPLDGDLTSIASLSGTSGFLKKTAANTWSLDTSTYLDTTTAASTYQTQSGMSSYLTTSSASSTYQTLAGMTSYLLSSTATSTYVALAGSTMTGNLTFSGNGRKIIGDFNNATVANRLSFQTSTANAETVPYIIPNGTGNTAGIVAANASDPTNSSIIRMSVNGSTDTRINSDINGTGTYLPLTIYTGGSERMRLDTSGNMGVGASTGLDRITAQNDQNASTRIAVSNQDAGSSAQAALRLSASGATWDVLTGSSANNSNSLTIGLTSSEFMRITSGGNVGIGTSAPAASMSVVKQTTTLSGTGNPYGLYLYPTSSGLSYVDSVTNSTGNTSLGLRTYNNGTYNEVRIDSSGNVGIGTTAPVNKLDVTGSFGRGAPVTKTGNFTLAATENWIICNGTGSITVTLPAASSWTGRELTIKTIAAQTVVSASSNVVPLNSATAGTAILAATAGKFATLVSDGTNWVIMAAN